MTPVAYRELAPPPSLEALVACVWLSHDGEVRVLPDACVDVVLTADRLLVAGPATRVAIAPPTPGQPRVGVRFRVGAAGAALGLPAGELRDQGVALSELWGADARRLEDRVAAAPDPHAALLALIGGLAQRLPPPEAADHEVRRAALALARGQDDVVAAARAANLSERQLRRRFERAVGYGPATLARVLRFQRFLQRANAPGAASAPLARLAAEAGYADQAHLARECRRLSGLPPSALLAAGAGPAGRAGALRLADPFKAPGTRMRDAAPMPADLAAAAQFVHGHGRLLERRRFDHLFGTTPDAAGVLRAVDAYRNADGGVGFLEPDIRTPASQPSAVLYAFEVLEEVEARPDGFTAGALDWLQTVTNADGGIPFVLPTAKGWPHAPWWAPQDDPPSSLLMTAGVAAAAHRLRLDHPWQERADAFVWAAMADLQLSDPYAFRYTVHFLDATPDRERARAELDALRARMPADGVLKVEAGVEGETLSALEVAPRPDHAGRALFPGALVEAQLDELAAAQRDDGGWDFSWAAWNPAVAFEWRGMVTLDALTTLRAYGRL